MKTPKIIHPKFISILAILLGALYFLPPIDYWLGIPWVLAGIFVWRKNKFASAAVLILALYLFAIEIREIPSFPEYVQEQIAECAEDDLGLSGGFVATFLILSLLFQTFFLSIFVYHGIYVLKPISLIRKTRS